jgi:hypothetical protein
MSQLRIQRIQQKIVAKGVRLSPSLTEAELAAFEKRHNVTLPEDYRAFLSLIGDGGDGPPHYGLCRLGATPSDLGDTLHFSRPFPFTKPWVWEDGEESDEGTHEQIYQGVLIISTEGCGQNWTLVINGPEHGHVWNHSDVGMQPLNPAMTFLDWYEAWLDGRTNWWG